MENSKPKSEMPKRQKCLVYSRVCGYIRPTESWNVGKKEEFNDRKTFKVE